MEGVPVRSGKRLGVALEEWPPEERFKRRSRDGSMEVDKPVTKLPKKKKKRKKKKEDDKVTNYWTLQTTAMNPLTMGCDHECNEGRAEVRKARSDKPL